MTAATARIATEAPTNARTRISIPSRRGLRAGRRPVLADALDFWQYAGAPANVAMQMAMPGVGRGVVESRVESGALMHHPYKRLRTTTTYLNVALQGSPEVKAAFREAVNGAHRQVRSAPGAAVKYNAFDRDLQRWVAACLYVGYEDSYQLINGRMTPGQLESFYASSATFGTTLQMTEDMWPRTRAEFETYWNETCLLLSVDEEVRAYIDDMVNLRMINPVLRGLFGGLLGFLTRGFLAPYFRDVMGIDWTPADQRRFEQLFAVVGVVNSLMPQRLRFAPNRAMLRDVERRIREGKRLI
ncbi:oxygenase MpaB family protein [Nocardia thailandica]|uniref:Oxygenase MpaB family protein n=1 Tax=Nocardia thailandica TaxID=257275 RepID=A0ABW6PHY2_9NOCA